MLDRILFGGICVRDMEGGGNSEKIKSPLTPLFLRGEGRQKRDFSHSFAMTKDSWWIACGNGFLIKAFGNDRMW